MLKLDYDAIHRFVSGHPGASWDGWDVLMWKETPLGVTSPKGARRGEKWGIETRISPNTEGRWIIRA